MTTPDIDTMIEKLSAIESLVSEGKTAQQALAATITDEQRSPKINYVLQLNLVLVEQSLAKMRQCLEEGDLKRSKEHFDVAIHCVWPSMTVN